MSEVIFERVCDEQETRAVSYLEAGHTLKSWLTTTDHKRIGILYALAITVFFFIGGIAIGLARLELMNPNGALFSDEGYNRLFTLHGVVMVWFFLVPSIPATFGNFLLPLMIGAHDVAFPRLNLFSWYISCARGGVHLLRACRWRRRYRLDLLHAFLHHSIPIAMCWLRPSASSWSGFPPSRQA